MNRISVLEYLGLYLDKSLPISSNCANFTAIIKEMVPDLNWVGIYVYENNQLYLGPFQGKAAVSSIPMGEGVCGVSAKKQEIMVVDDVHQFEGHIACDEVSNAEVVFPIIIKDQLYGVLDIDSPVFNRFDEATVDNLKKAVDYLVEIIEN